MAEASKLNRENRVPERRILKLAIGAVALASAVAPASLGATAASAATITHRSATVMAAPISSAVGHGHSTDPADRILPAQDSAGAPSTPYILNKRINNSSCYDVGLTEPEAFEWSDPGLHQDVRITPNLTCYTYQVVAGGNASILRINGGSDCLKVVYPDPNENEYAVDEGCSTTDPLEQFTFAHQSNGGNVICLYPQAYSSDCLAVSANLNNEIVGGKQRGPNVWFFLN